MQDAFDDDFGASGGSGYQSQVLVSAVALYTYNCKSNPPTTHVQEPSGGDMDVSVSGFSAQTETSVAAPLVRSCSLVLGTDQISLIVLVLLYICRSQRGQRDSSTDDPLLQIDQRVQLSLCRRLGKSNTDA